MSKLPQIKPKNNHGQHVSIKKVSVLKLLKEVSEVNDLLKNEGTLLVTNIDRRTPNRNEQTIYGSNLFRSSISLSTTRLSPREMIQQMSSRASMGMSAPSYVNSIDNLSLDSFSWRESKSASRKKINIIGCHQPVELILAKADRRIRRAQKAQTIKNDLQATKLKKIQENVLYENVSDERYKSLLYLKRRQYTWILIVKTLTFISSVREKWHISANLIYHFRYSTNLMIRIRNYFLNWYSRHMFKKYRLGFLKSLKNSEHILRMNIRIKRKRRALIVIRCFCIETRSKNNKYLVKIRHYFVAVKIIQRCIKRIIAKREAQIKAVGIVWEKLEYLFLSKSFQDAKEKRGRDKKLKPLETRIIINNSNLDKATKIIMNNQETKWNEIDSKLDEAIKSLKIRRFLKVETIEEKVNKLRLSKQIRKSEIENFISLQSREFYDKNKNDLRIALSHIKTTSYTQQDASNMLLGKKDQNVEKSVLLKMGSNKIMEMHKKNIFNIFTAINNMEVQKRLYNNIRVAHKEFGTFDRKISSIIL